MWSRLLRANFAYAVGSVANTAALFLLVPFMVNSLSTVEYGAWSIIEVTILLLTMLTLSGMDIGMMRHYWYLDNDKLRSRLSGTILISIIVWGGLLSLIIITLYFLVPNLRLNFIKPLSLSLKTLILILGIVLLESIFLYLINIFRIREQPRKFVSLSLGRMILFLIGAIFGIRVLGNIDGALLGRLFAGIIGVLAAVLLSYKLINLTFDFNQYKKVIAYGLPLLPANLASYVLIASDRYFLNIYSSLEIVAIYTFTYKLASTFDILITRPFATDWAARRFEIARSSNAKKKYSDILLIYIFVSAFTSLAIIALAPIIYKYVAPSTYREGYRVLPILLMAMIAFGLSYPLNIGIVIKDKTIFAAITGIISAFICLGIEFILIPRFGMEGAAWSTLISNIIWTGGLAYFSQRFYPINYQLNRLAALLVAIILGYLGLIFIFQMGVNGELSLWLNFMSLGWLVLVFGFAGITLKKKIIGKNIL